MTAQELIQIRESKKLTKSAFAAALGITALLEGRYEGGKLSIPDKIADKVKEVFPDQTEQQEEKTATKEIKKPDRKPRKEKTDSETIQPETKTEEISSPASEAVPAAEKKAPVEKKAPAEKKTRAAKGSKKAGSEKAPAGRSKSKAPQFIIESSMGGTITPEEILSRIPKDVDTVYVKPEDNKAYWVKGDETDSVDLW